MQEKFIQMLKQDLTETVHFIDDVKEKKAGRGRPKKKNLSSKDEEKNEGVRDITLIAKIKIDGKTEEETKVIKNCKTENFDKEMLKFEKEVNKKFDYEGDVTVKMKIGDYEGTADAKDQRKAVDSDDDDYSIAA